MTAKVIKFRSPVYIFSSAAVGTDKEKNGPLGEYFDITSPDAKFGCDTFEKGESEMLRVAVNAALKKASLHEKELELFLAGDLMNQCTASTFALLDYGIPFAGLYGACSTMAEALALGSILIDSSHFSLIGTAVSSNFCTAERQFRVPLEYGSRKPPTAQWTVTGAGAVILSNKPRDLRGTDINKKEANSVAVVEALIGRMVDLGITDAANMGAAMAPAAADTILRYFRETGRTPDEFDIIATGDLGEEGVKLCRDLLAGEGLDLGSRHKDCGVLIYGEGNSNKNGERMSGGSGCACSAVVLAGYFARLFANQKIKRLLFVGTGAMMSPQSVMQGLSIPGIAHAVTIEAM
ncbi:stage V sporulation protein AD [Clostridia bacterium]|nr:stage V sporulation protein AD [Clostridia bacterium]